MGGKQTITPEKSNEAELLRKEIALLIGHHGFDAQDVADMIGVGKSAIYRWIRNPSVTPRYPHRYRQAIAPMFEKPELCRRHDDDIPDGMPVLAMVVIGIVVAAALAYKVFPFG